jgi:hypothetical protein
MTPSRACVAATGWPLERVLFAMAGTVSLVAVTLSALVSPWFLILVAFVAVNQWLYVVFGACGASILLSRVFGLRSTLYRSTLEGDLR